MCYSIQQLEERIRKQGLRNRSTPAEIEQAIELFRKQQLGKPFFIASGFDHPTLPVLIRSEGQLEFQPMQWGLIPHFVEDSKQANEWSNITLNARGETMFDKPAFRQAARQHRGLLLVTGFYEYHHDGKRKTPHFVDWSDEQARLVAVIFDHWNHPTEQFEYTSFSIVTCGANPFMAALHHGTGELGPRMPLFLHGEHLLTWINPDSTQEEIQRLVRSDDEDGIRSHAVRPLRGKQAVGNTALASAAWVDGAQNEQLRLFGF